MLTCYICGKEKFSTIEIKHYICDKCIKEWKTFEDYELPTKEKQIVETIDDYIKTEDDDSCEKNLEN